MAENKRTKENREFIDTCRGLSLLDESQASTLHKAIADSDSVNDTFASQVAMRLGLLNAADVDIVHALQHPTSIVPGYEILQVVGRGGMGVVYRAKQIDLDRIVALKTVLIGNVNDSIASARFEREAKSVARMHHPHIVQAINFGMHHGRYFFAMEYAVGRTCEQAVETNGPIPPANAWSIVRQVASGLLHASHQNLIHRDIKPANLILVSPPEGSSLNDEMVKITDFGLAMFADQEEEEMRLTTGGQVIGSPAYMSPEQFGGESVDLRSDLYSLGATAWHLLFSTPPFRGKSIAEVYRQKTKPMVVDRDSLLVQLPDDQMALLASMLHPDPAKRPQTYEDLIVAIDQLELDEFDFLHSSEFAGPGIDADSPTMQFSTGTNSEASSTDLPPLKSASSVSTSTSALSSADSMQQTSAETAMPKLKRGPWLRWSVSAAVLLILVSFIGWALQPGIKIGERTHRKVTGGVPLFDGVTLLGWGVDGSMIGSWNTARAPDGSNGIACSVSRGAITRRIPETRNPESEVPRLQIFVWLQKGCGPVDIDFGFDVDQPDDLRGTLRMTDTFTKLGTKAEDFADLNVMTKSASLPTIHQRYHVVHLEKQPTDWFVFLEEKFIGAIPIQRIGQGNAIRLVVHGSDLASLPLTESTPPVQAYFSDIQLFELSDQRSKRVATTRPE